MDPFSLLCTEYAIYNIDENIFSLWLFNGFRFFLFSFYFFRMCIFVGTAGANVACLCCFLYCTMFIDFTSSVSVCTVLFSALFSFIAIDWNGRTSGNVHILTFPWALFLMKPIEKWIIYTYTRTCGVNEFYDFLNKNSIENIIDYLTNKFIQLRQWHCK